MSSSLRTSKVLVIELEVQLEGPIGQASTPLQHSHGLIQHLLKGHGLPFPCPEVLASPHLVPIVPYLRWQWQACLAQARAMQFSKLPRPGQGEGWGEGRSHGLHVPLTLSFSPARGEGILKASCLFACIPEN
jgi:hypothetical protein